jgi:hypothetical protein
MQLVAGLLPEESLCPGLDSLRISHSLCHRPGIRRIRTSTFPSPQRRAGRSAVYIDSGGDRPLLPTETAAHVYFEVQLSSTQGDCFACAGEVGTDNGGGFDRLCFAVRDVWCACTPWRPARGPFSAVLALVTNTYGPRAVSHLALGITNRH